MITIYDQKNIDIRWEVFKVANNVHEDFSQAEIWMFLVSDEHKYPLHTTLDGNFVLARVDAGAFAPGTYSAVLMWLKNPETSKDLTRTELDNIFALTPYEEEDNSRVDGDVTVTLKSMVATYGYDGLDAYERAIMLGRFWGSEEEWMQSLGDHDLANYYTKGEVDELIDNVEVDLSDYYTKEQTDTKINEAAGRLHDEVEENTDAINDVSQRVSTNTQGIADNTDAITENTEDINQLKSGMTTMGGRVDELETEMDNFVGLNQSNYMGMFPDVNSLPAMTEKGWAWVGSDMTAMACYVWFNATDGWTRYGSNTYDLTDYTQVAAQVAQIGLKIGDVLGFEASVIDLTQFTRYRGVINNTWTATDSYQYRHIFVPVIVGRNYTIVADSSNKARYAFMKSVQESPQTGDAPDYCDGYTSDFVVDVNESSTFTIPSDCAALYVAMQWGNYAISAPLSLTLDATKGRLKSAETKIEELESAMNDVTEQQDELQESKVNKSDVVNDTTTGGTDKPLSAEQGKLLDKNKIGHSEIVNNLTDGGTAKPLSAEQGKILQSSKVSVSAIVDNLNDGGSSVPLSAEQGKILNNTKLGKNEVVNNLSTIDSTKALSASQGKELKDGLDGAIDNIVQIEDRVNQSESDIDVIRTLVDALSVGHFYGYKASASELPSVGNGDGYAYVGSAAPYAIYNAVSSNSTLTWTNSGATISNLATADEEDIDYDANGKLKLANRSVATNQKGYKILRKGVALSTQMTDANTIYEVRYAFDLDGGTLTIPSGCTLKFNGGAIKNCSIAFSNTTLDKKDADNIFYGVTSFSGTLRGCYLTPDNFSTGTQGDCLTAGLAYLKTQQVMLKAENWALNGDTDLNGVWLDADKITLNSYTLRLGGSTNRISDVSSSATKSQNQRILAINTNGNFSGRVIVGKCNGYELYIGHYNGKLEFIIDENNGGIAYSTFVLNTVASIEITAADGVSEGWVNTNRFVLNRCVKFRVLSPLVYFNNNQIQMGCFEGQFNIHLERGNDNTFMDIRGESQLRGFGELYFGEETLRNRLSILYYPLTRIYDYGKDNIIIDNVLYNSRLIDQANISLQDLKKGLPSRITGMSVSEDGTYMIPSSEYDIIPGFETLFARYYMSGYIPYKKRMTIFAILDVVSKNDPGLFFTFELYDENFNPVFVRDSNGTGITLALIRTADDSFNVKAGRYFRAFDPGINSKPGTAGNKVDNRYVLFQFDDSPAINKIVAGDTVAEESLSNVKYITISVMGSAYYSSFNSQLLSVGVSLYKPGFKVRYFNSDIDEEVQQ